MLSDAAALVMAESCEQAAGKLERPLDERGFSPEFRQRFPDLFPEA